MLHCHRFIFSHSKFLSNRRFTNLLIATRYNSSSIDISKILQEQSINFEQKSTKTIAFETFIQTPSEFVANNLLQIHDHLNLPWWLTITLATISFRFLIGASITIMQQRFVERLQKVQRNVSNELEPKVRILNMQAMQGKTATILEEKKFLKRKVKDSYIFVFVFCFFFSK